MEWKNHPVIVAVTAGAVTMAFCVTTVLPIWTKVLENRVEENRKEISVLKDSARVLVEKANYYERRNKALLWDDLLSSSTAYPKGFNDVRIGDSISKVDQVFKGANIDHTKNKWVTVQLLGKSESIDIVTYYFDETSRVSHILYFFSRVDEENSPLKDVDGKFGAVGESVYSYLKSAYPNAKTNCDTDEDYLECKLFAPGYDFKVTSKTFHVDARN